MNPPPIYLRVMSARSLLAQPTPEKPAEDHEGGAPRSGGGVIVLKPGEEYDPANYPHITGKVIILPSRDAAPPSVEDRQRQRLERLAEMQMVDNDDDPEPLVEVPPPPRPLTGRQRLKLMRERRRATREAPGIWSD